LAIVEDKRTLRRKVSCDSSPMRVLQISILARDRPRRDCRLVLGIVAVAVAGSSAGSVAASRKANSQKSVTRDRAEN
jgi:hypothetical protein